VEKERRKKKMKKIEFQFSIYGGRLKKIELESGAPED